MTIELLSGDIHLIDLETRLPFKYGIATMTEAPHAFVRLRVVVDGVAAVGVAADHLPPKWFTKVPDKPLDDEVDEMLATIEQAISVAAGVVGETAFEVWRELYEVQAEWGREVGYPPLLANFGMTLVERALIEAVARAKQSTLSELVRSDQLGIRLDECDPRLAGRRVAELLPVAPLGRVVARHTVGMADPLTDAEIGETERLDDGLPQSLEACIKRYGLAHLKIKVNGDLDSDLERLRAIAVIVTAASPPDFAFTLDGNEQFHDLAAFEGYWRELTSRDDLVAFFERLLFVEQPFHRDVALDDQVLAGLAEWDSRPRMIIDESDAETDSLARALRLGYHGTSHKNCKGVFRGIINACLLAEMNRRDAAGGTIMSGEDLANIGPVALLQDLAVAATIGVESVERNGHHYFAGLSAFPAAVQQQVLDAHGDLYRRTDAGWPTLDVRDGQVELGSINRAPFGLGFQLDVEQFTPASAWREEHGL